MTWLPTLTQIKTLYRANTTRYNRLMDDFNDFFIDPITERTLKHWSMYPSFLVIEGLVYIRCFNPSVEQGGFVLYRGVENNTMRKLSIEEIEKHFTSMMEVVDLSKPVRASKTTHYECSSKGDGRFSAFNAVLWTHQGRTIEQIYQGEIKGHDVGGTRWWLGKGKPAINGKGYDQLLDEYFSLWDTWCSNHRVWMHELHYLAACCNYNLSDGFATTAINQASALASWLNANHWDGITSLLESNHDENDT